MFYNIEEIMMLEREEARRQAREAMRATTGPGDEEDDEEDEGVEVVSDEALAAAMDMAFGY